MGFANFFGACFSSIIIAKFPRRKIFIFGHIEMGLSHLLIGIFIKLKNQNLIILAMVFAILGFQNSCGPTFWIYGSEIGTEIQLGIFLTVLMGSVTLVAFIIPILMFGSFGVVNTFFLLAAI